MFVLLVIRRMADDATLNAFLPLIHPADTTSVWNAVAKGECDKAYVATTAAQRGENELYHQRKIDIAYRWVAQVSHLRPGFVAATEPQLRRRGFGRTWKTRSQTRELGHPSRR